MTKTEMQVMEFFWETGKSYTFAELQKYFTEKKGCAKIDRKISEGQKLKLK